ncbi:RHS repeat-associated core domain-containing protein, partial [Chryseobacterium sp.]|uniref:RHS repeat-associated core domain-containing protein n=1 Tax=Chryseobacterium sp. TaxID=1871047 RepID=UPI002625FF82
KMTDYLDGFQYNYIETSGPCLWCKTSVAYEAEAYRDKNIFDPGIISPIWLLDFVPTAEGFYSFIENRYIYQYKDHLGNARVSFAKDSTGTPEITDANNYYAFGMNHIGGVKGLLGGYMNYKYNGKELQETGMYDYGARFYMPDIGRWGIVDPLAEVNRSWSPYRYAYNNPLRFIDPDGRLEDWYQDNATGNIAWHDGSAERAGQTNLTQEADGKLLAVEEKDGSGNTTAMNMLNNDGSITRNGETITNGYSTTTVVGRTITSRQPWEAIVNASGNSGGMGGEFRFSMIVGYGWSGALGYVSADRNNGSSFYANINFGVGLDMGPALDLYSVNPPEGHDFKIGDIEGRGMSYSGSAFFLNGSYGGTDYDGTFQLRDMNPSNFGLNKQGANGYTTTGIGINPFGFGGSYQYGHTKSFWTTPAKN